MLSKDVAKKKMQMYRNMFIIWGIFFFVILSIVAFSCFGKTRTNIEKQQVKLPPDQNLADSYWRAFGGLIQLSNEIYKLDEIVNEPEFNKGKWLVQLSFVKEQASYLITEMNKLPYPTTINPVLEICESIIKFIDLYSINYINEEEQKLSEEKGMAEFKLALSKLDDYLFKAMRVQGAFNKYTIARFDRKALEKYRSILYEPLNKEYNVFLLFGYKMYNAAVDSMEKGNVINKKEG